MINYILNIGIMLISYLLFDFYCRRNTGYTVDSEYNALIKKIKDYNFNIYTIVNNKNDINKIIRIINKIDRKITKEYDQLDIQNLNVLLKTLKSKHVLAGINLSFISLIFTIFGGLLSYIFKTYFEIKETVSLTTPWIFFVIYSILIIRTTLKYVEYLFTKIQLLSYLLEQIANKEQGS